MNQQATIQSQAAFEEFDGREQEVVAALSLEDLGLIAGGECVVNSI